MDSLVKKMYKEGINADKDDENMNAGTFKKHPHSFSNDDPTNTASTDPMSTTTDHLIPTTRTNCSFYATDNGNSNERISRNDHTSLRNDDPSQKTSTDSTLTTTDVVIATTCTKFCKW